MSWKDLLPNIPPTVPHDPSVTPRQLGNYPVADFVLGDGLMPDTGSSLAAKLPMGWKVIDGAAEAGSGIWKKLLAQKFSALYAQPSTGGELLDGVSRITAPNKRLAEWHSIGERAFPWDVVDKAGQKVSSHDIEPVVRGIERGNFTELVPSYTPLNKTWAWGKGRLAAAPKPSPEGPNQAFLSWIKKQGIGDEFLKMSDDEVRSLSKRFKDRWMKKDLDEKHNSFWDMMTDPEE